MRGELNKLDLDGWEERAKSAAAEDMSKCQSQTPFPGCPGPQVSPQDLDEDPDILDKMCGLCQKRRKKIYKDALEQCNTMMGDEICKKCHMRNAEMENGEWAYCGTCRPRDAIQVKESKAQKAKSFGARLVQKLFGRCKDDV